MSKKGYRKLKGSFGIYKHEKSGNFMARTQIADKFVQKTFETLYQAKEWIGEQKCSVFVSKQGQFSTLAHVWNTMQEIHFPTLARSTQEVWIRRYALWKSIEHMQMDQITPSAISTWVQSKIEFFKSDNFQSNRRGKAGRCNLRNELNLFVTIFNWYKESEVFEGEAMQLVCPIKKRHKEAGFIKPVPAPNKQISVEDTYLFFNFLRPLYRELASIQFYTAGRIGEIAGLQWNNIDLKNRRMLIKETCIWCMSHKTFRELKPFPKNKEPRPCFITDEIMEILLRRRAFKISGNNFVFHVDGNPLNYSTIQANYRDAQQKSGVPFSGTHILRHGMAKLARKIGGGLDAVMAMTGHKDVKMANHYSKCNEADQRDIAEKVMRHIRQRASVEKGDKVVSLVNLCDEGAGHPGHEIKLTNKG